MNTTVYVFTLDKDKYYISEFNNEYNSKCCIKFFISYIYTCLSIKNI